MAAPLRRGEHSGYEDFELGDGGGPLTEKLIALVLDGTKTATCSLLAEFVDEGREVPAVGSRWALIDGAGRERGVVETLEARVMRLADVDDAFARDEGEGDENAAQWRAGHERFWRRHVPHVELGDDTQVVAERFRLVALF
ncbi:MAG TPA: ASCH domain-containing protein [Solirubrobacteraceae bacterium]|nr:ASCH domain-containing protein [Solirubrobacteraceae bacterium]